MTTYADSSNSSAPSQGVPVVGREEFVRAWRKNYHDGQHLTMLGPTQRGKTTLCFQLLKQSISPERRCVVLAGKPPLRDPVMGQAAKQLNLRIVESWPPNWSPKDRNRNGWVLRPHQGMKDLDADNENVQKEFRHGIMRNYASHVPIITVVDEGHHVQNDLKLKKECEAILMRGAPHSAMWTLVQRGRYVSMQCYDAPEHIFIFADPDVDNQRRYSEIGGIDPQLLRYLVTTLKMHSTPKGNTISECIYIKRSGPEVMIVDVT